MARSQPGAARQRTQPVRTCVGCRERAVKPELVRVVAVRDQSAHALAPDPLGTAGGRGAHVHPTVACLDLAVRRKAFGRALRVQGPLDDSALRAHLAGVEITTTDDRTTSPTGPVDDQKRSTSS